MRALNCFALALALFAPFVASAAQISGVVHDASKAKHRPLAGAQVLFTNAISGAQVAATSGADGKYAAVLGPGQYYVTALHAAFETATTNWARLKVGAAATVLTHDFTLKNANRDALSAFVGVVYEFDGSCRWQSKGPLTRIDFTSTDLARHFVVMSDANGSYRVNLPPGGYFVTAARSGRYSSDTAPGVYGKIAAREQSADVELNRDAPIKCF